ncbi:glycosyl hydrolase family 18 protein [Gryllotalpicola reticulitermitis]|uniref:chitinase n=1 Tax=Gryllotalpicola reticulitermitis TaxID=1184153 RepID=A0ABV8Q9Z7_9MICO
MLIASYDADVVKSVPWAAREYATAGTLVLHGGALYQNKWWAGPSDEPGRSDAWAKLREPNLTPLAEFGFTPWSGAIAEAFQRDERQRGIDQTKVVGYFPEWGIYEAHDSYTVADIPFDKITHLNYAFGLLKKGADGTWGVAVGDSWAALEKNGGLYSQLAAATAANGVENMLSIGGWTNSEHGEFEDATATPSKAERLADSMVTFMDQHGFTGLDIDWEYPRTARAADQFEGLLSTLRTKLTEIGKERDQYYPLSIAVSPNHTLMEYIKPSVIKDLVDTVNVMSYDYHGAFDPVTGHNSPLTGNSLDADPKLNTTATMAEFHERYGIDKKQLLVGVPYYGRGWGDVEPTEKIAGLPGLGTSGTATVAGAWDDAGQRTGTNPWYLLKGLESDSGYEKYWDDESQVPYLYNRTTKTFLTYDDPRSVQAKVDFIRDNNYGGAIIWDLTGDTKDHQLGNIVGQLLEKSDQPDENSFAPTLRLQNDVKNVVPQIVLPSDAYDSADRYIVRHNGNYVMEIYRGAAYYSSVKKDSTSVVVSRSVPAAVGDSFSLERAPGTPGRSSAGAEVLQKVSVTAAHLTPNAAAKAGVVSIRKAATTVDLTLSRTAFDGANRYMVMLNGKYLMEARNGKAYYSSKTATSDTVTLTNRGAFKPGDRVEVWLASNYLSNWAPAAVLLDTVEPAKAVAPQLR